MKKGRDNAGQVLPLVAISLAVLLGFAGLSVDVGYLQYWQQQQQTATDAAALGGAEYNAHSNCASGTSAQAAAQADASGNSFTNAGNISVTAASPPLSGPYSGNACAVAVSITSQHVSTFFSRLFGYPSGMSETTQAIASVSSNGGGACIYLLSMNSWSSFNQATVSSPGCAIAINYSADFNGGTIAAPSIGYAGGTPNYGGTTFTLATPAPMLAVADPCPQIAGCAAITASPPPTTNCSGVNTNGNTTLNPGCYTYLNLNPPGTVTMNPGTYVITQNVNDNGVTLQGTGVTIYIPAGGNGPNFDGQTVTLSPPTTGSYAGVLYYQVPSNSSSINFNGPNVRMSGLVYSPGTTSANFDGANGSYVVLVFGSMNFNGNTAFDFASPPPGQSLVKQAVLVQ
jgi:hypothetical protein